MPHSPRAARLSTRTQGRVVILCIANIVHAGRLENAIPNKTASQLNPPLLFYMFYSHKSFFILTNSRFGAPLAKAGADHSPKIGEHFSVGRVLGYILVFKVFHVVQLRVIPVVV